MVRGMSQNMTSQNNNSHPAAHRKIESSFNANSYINNSSVAKTSMQKRRNISFSGAVSTNKNNNYIDQQRPSIIDLENSISGVSSNPRNSRPVIINNTYDGTGGNNQRVHHHTSNVTPSNKFNGNFIRSNESAFSNRNSRDYVGQGSANVTLNGGSRSLNKKQNPDTSLPKFSNSEQQPSHKYPQYIEELLLSSQQQQFSYDT